MEGAIAQSLQFPSLVYSNGIVKNSAGKTAGIVAVENTVTTWPYRCFGLLPGQVYQRFAKQTALQGR